MKIILALAPLLIFSSQIFAFYDPSLGYEDIGDYYDRGYDDRDYDDRDYDDSDFVDYSSNEQQDPNKVWIDSKELIIPKNNCFIKGNISDTGEKIYHIQGCDYYEQTIISKEGEEFFCSEYEAYKAGFRKALNCPPPTTNKEILTSTSQGTGSTLSSTSNKPSSYIDFKTPITFLLLFMIFFFRDIISGIIFWLSRFIFWLSRLFVWDTYIYLFKLPLVLFSKIFAYGVYIYGIAKYARHGSEVKMRYIKVWLNNLEKNKPDGFFKTLHTRHLLEILQNRTK